MNVYVLDQIYHKTLMEHQKFYQIQYYIYL